MKKNIQTIELPKPAFWQKYMHIILCALAFLAYANTLTNGYNMDDELVTRKQKLTSKGISAIPEIFSSPYYSDNMGYSYEYRPIVLVSFAIEHQFFGDKAGVSHFFNVVLYMLSIFLLFKILQKLLHSYSYWLSVLCVLLFIFHPMHTEVVASIKNRDEILALLGGLGAWWFSIRYIQQGKLWTFPLIFICFLMGLLSKMSIVPMMFLIPFSLVLFQEVKGIRIVILSIFFCVIVFVLAYISFTFTVDYLYALCFISILPYLIWLLMNGKHKNIWQNIKKEFAGIGLSINEKNDELASPDNYGFQKISLQKNEILNGYFLLKIFPFIVCMLLSIYYLNQIYITVGFVYFGLVFFTSTDSQKNVIVPLFSVCFSLVCLIFIKPEFVDYAAFFIFLYYVLYTSARNIVTIISYLILIPVYFYLDAEINILLTGIGFLIFIFSDKNKITRIISKVVIGVLIVSIIQSIVLSVINTSVHNEFIFYLIFNTLFIFILLRKRIKYVLSVLLFIVIPLLPLLQIDSTPINSYSANQSTYIQHNQGHYTNTVISKPFYESERPISFAEIPVNKSASLENRLGISSTVLGFYLHKMLLPYPMGYYYGYAFFKPVSIFGTTPLVFLLVHIFIFIISILLLKKHRAFAFGVLFYLISIALFSGFIYPVVGVAGDRFTYVASLGFALAVAYILLYFIGRLKSISKTDFPAKWVLGTCLLVLSSYSVITWTRNAQWEGPLVLMENDIKYLDESAQAHNLYALNLMRETFENKKIKQQEQLEMRKLAVLHFDKALQIWPGFFNAAYDKGRAALIIGDYESSISGFKRAIEIGPEEGFVDPYFQLGQLYLQTGKNNEYLQNAKNMLAFKEEAEAYNMVSRGFYMIGKNDSAKIYLHRAMEKYPQDISLRKNMAQIFKAEQVADSVSYYLGAN